MKTKQKKMNPKKKEKNTRKRNKPFDGLCMIRPASPATTEPFHLTPVITTTRSARTPASPANLTPNPTPQEPITLNHGSFCGIPRVPGSLEVRLSLLQYLLDKRGSHTVFSLSLLGMDGVIVIDSLEEFPEISLGDVAVTEGLDALIESFV